MKIPKRIVSELGLMLTDKTMGAGNYLYGLDIYRYPHPDNRAEIYFCECDTDGKRLKHDLILLHFRVGNMRQNMKIAIAMMEDSIDDVQKLIEKQTNDLIASAFTK